MIRGVIGLIVGGLFAVAPSSSNYTLKSYDLGAGGGGSSSSSNYRLNGELGAQGGQAMTSTNYTARSGETVTQNANVPPAPNLSNPSNEYSRLRLVLNTGNNASDTLFAIAISSDDFVSAQYVKSDMSIGTSLALTDYMTYASWGGGSGFWITGLAPSTTYKVKVKAMQGDFTESAYGPKTSGVATVTPTLSFGLATNPPAGPPYGVAFSGLNGGIVYSANADAVLSLSTNALLGGEIYIRDSNAGLASASASTTISSATADLSSVSSGYGAMVTSTSQSSGGPLTSLSPFNGSSNNVGGLTTSLQKLASTTNSITNGSVTVQFKAKATTTTPAASDYVDTVTFIAAMLY